MSVLFWSVLAVHVAIIAFNVAGLVVIPLGAWRRWAWVRGFWWRSAHLVIFAVVAVQALAGRACILTLWQSEINNGGTPTPLIAGWIEKVIYLPLPLWVFTVLYVIVWLYVLALWWRVPPRLPWKASGRKAA